MNLKVGDKVIFNKKVGNPDRDFVEREGTIIRNDEDGHIYEHSYMVKYDILRGYGTCKIFYKRPGQNDTIRLDSKRIREDKLKQILDV